jgi:hypothetical protein
MGFGHRFGGSVTCKVTDQDIGLSVRETEVPATGRNVKRSPRPMSVPTYWGALAGRMIVQAGALPGVEAPSLTLNRPTSRSGLRGQRRNSSVSRRSFSIWAL